MEASALCWKKHELASLKPRQRRFFYLLSLPWTIFSFSFLLFVGLYHGKDIRFGCSISHSHHRTNRCWRPNVQNKRLWSDALNDWVRFKITTAAIKAVDNYGGIDNYMLALDERLVQDSNYLIKVRGLIAAAVYHKGELSPKLIKRLGYHKNPPPPPAAAEVQAVGAAELA